jgi:uncharacterized protein
MGPVFDPITDAHVERCRAAYRMVTDGDPAFLDLLDPDVEWYVPDSLPGGGALRGHWDVLAFLDTSGQFWDDPRPEPEDFLASGDKLVVLGNWCGRAKSTGIEMKVPFAHVQQFRDGKLVYFRNYIDATEVMKTLEEPPSG